MVGVVVTGHGGFAAGMAANVKMLAGSDAELKAVDFADGMDVEVFEKQLAEAIDSYADCEAVLVLADIAGGTPYNRAAGLSMTRPKVRVQCAFIDTPEVEEITKFIARQQSYPTPFFLPEFVSEDGGSEVGDIDMGRLDPLFEDAARLVVIHQQGSTSLIQRKFAIGYNRAGRIMDQLEKAGIVGPTQGSKARDVLCMDDNDLEMRLNNLQ